MACTGFDEAGEDYLRYWVINLRNMSVVWIKAYISPELRREISERYGDILYFRDGKVYPKNAEYMELVNEIYIALRTAANIKLGTAGDVGSYYEVELYPGDVDFSEADKVKKTMEAM